LSTAAAKSIAFSLLTGSLSDKLILSTETKWGVCVGKYYFDSTVIVPMKLNIIVA